MDDDFIFWEHTLPVGIKIEEISGKDNISQKIWLQMAYQIFGEYGKENYRNILHFDNGAPFINGMPQRISITHTSHFLAVAFIPITPESDLASFNPQTALGIDAEKINREQVLKIREKFLSDNELKNFDAEDVKANIMAWTAKEAVYKATFQPELDYKNKIIIHSLPELENSTAKKFSKLGKAILKREENGQETSYDFLLYSYESEGNCVTVAFTPSTALFKHAPFK